MPYGKTAAVLEEAFGLRAGVPRQSNRLLNCLGRSVQQLF
jgi:hypothetical protein